MNYNNLLLTLAPKNTQYLNTPSDSQKFVNMLSFDHHLKYKIFNKMEDIKMDKKEVVSNEEIEGKKDEKKTPKQELGRGPNSKTNYLKGIYKDFDNCIPRKFNAVCKSIELELSDIEKRQLKEFITSNYNLRYNIYILRETFRVLFKDSSTGFQKFYKSLNVKDDTLTNFIVNGTATEETRKRIDMALTPTALNRKYFRLENVRKIPLPDDLDDAIEEYFEECYSPSNSTKKDKEEYTQYVTSYIRFYLFTKNKVMLQLILTCFQLAEFEITANEFDIWEISDQLHKIYETDFSKVNRDSEGLATFLTELAKSVNTVEKEFPEFYVFAQQLKTGKSVQTMMNEISCKLNALSNMEISKDDVQSIPCVNLMNEITQTMQKIHESIKTN